MPLRTGKEDGAGLRGAQVTEVGDIAVGRLTEIFSGMDPTALVTIGYFVTDGS